MASQLTGLLDQLQNFLFDLLGLVLPGFIFIFVLATPFLLVSIPSNVVCINSNDFVLLIRNLSTWIQDQSILESTLAIFIVSFILGHSVKVFSKLMYDLLKAIFDDTINKWCNWVIIKIGITKERFDSKKEKGLYPIIFVVIKYVSMIFTFNPQDYFKDNEPLTEESVKNFNEYYEAKFENKWRSVYKLSKIISAQENIKSLSYTYLAKYNFYRSISLIALFNILYDLFLLSKIGEGLQQYTFFVALLNFILWFTFHEKYKRYWMLCGDENLVSFYYFTLKKKKGFVKELNERAN